MRSHSAKKAGDVGPRWMSKNGLRQYRPPARKTGKQTKKYGKWQSNFEFRTGAKGKMTTNYQVRHRKLW